AEPLRLGLRVEAKVNLPLLRLRLDRREGPPPKNRGRLFARQRPPAPPAEGGWRRGCGGGRGGPIFFFQNGGGAPCPRAGGGHGGRACTRKAERDSSRDSGSRLSGKRSFGGGLAAGSEAPNFFSTNGVAPALAEPMAARTASRIRS